MFDRYEEEFVPLLEIMAAAKSTLSVEDLRSISGKGKRDVMRFQNGMSSFIRSENGSLSFYHKSLNDWMMDEEYSGEYCIDPGEGSRAILGAVRAALSSMSELSEHAYIREYAPDHLLEAKDMKSISRLLESDDEEVREHFFIRLSEHDAGTIESVLFGIGAQSDDVALNLAIRDVMFYLRYYRYVDKAHAVCDSMIAKRNQLSDLNFACVLTQKANAYHYGKEERYDLSKPLFEEAARILEESAQDPVRDYMLSMSYEGVGICYKNFGQHEKAMEYYIKAVGFTRAAYSSNPDRNTRRGLAIDCSNLGLSYSWMGDEEQSKRYYAEAHDLFRENYSKHPSFDTRRDYSVSLNRMGDLESDAGQARQYYEASMDLVKKNLDQMDSVQTNRDLARSFENLARLDERIGCMDDAISKYRQCRAILRKLLEDYPSVQNMRLYIRAVRSMLRLMKGDDAEELRSSVSEDISRAADLFPSPDMIRMRDEFNERSAFDGDYS